MNPLLQKKAGLNIRLVEHWAEIVGADIAASVLPLKIVWPRQSGAELRAGGLSAGLLTIGCFGHAALLAQHKTTEIRARINRFFGYQAIDRIKIEQKTAGLAAGAAHKKSAGGGLLGAFAGSGFNAPGQSANPPSAALQRQAAVIEDEALRAALLRLGANLHR